MLLITINDFHGKFEKGNSFRITTHLFNAPREANILADLATHICNTLGHDLTRV